MSFVASLFRPQSMSPIGFWWHGNAIPPAWLCSQVQDHSRGATISNSPRRCNGSMSDSCQMWRLAPAAWQTTYVAVRRRTIGNSATKREPFMFSNKACQKEAELPAAHHDVLGCHEHPMSFDSSCQLAAQHTRQIMCLSKQRRPCFLLSGSMALHHHQTIENCDLELV